MMVGLSAFWMHDVEPLFWVWEKLLFMFGGLMIPLAVYPVWIQKIAAFTPFSAILGARSALAIEFNFFAAFTLVMSLLAWISFTILLLRVFYRRGLHVLTIEGG